MKKTKEIIITKNNNLKIIQVCIICILLILSCIKPVYPDEIFLQHIATVIMIGIMIFLIKKNALSGKAFFCIFMMLIVHIIGARWNYSFTPYDKWINTVFGFSIDKYFSFKRNQYDRLVHFMYGFLLLIPISEIYNKWFNASKRLATHIAFLFILASSMVYELIEWLVAVTLSPEQAEAYNGQQGDMWDAQKDMAMAMLGAMVMIVISRYLVKKKVTTLNT